MVNKVILVGGLTRDAESLAGSRGAVTRMRLATSTHWRDAEGNRQEANEYHSLVAFNRLAEICALYCLKGRRIYVEGRLRTREYDGADGLRRTSTEVVVETMRLLGRRDEETPGGFASPDGSTVPAASPHDTGHTPDGEEEEEHEDEVPDESQLAVSGAGKR
jgi:single-strand DNA-binding protein